MVAKCKKRVLKKEKKILEKFEKEVKNTLVNPELLSLQSNLVANVMSTYSFEFPREGDLEFINSDFVTNWITENTQSTFEVVLKKYKLFTNLCKFLFLVSIPANMI